MTVLGIANAETSSACLLKDGEIVAAVSEERFTRIKCDSAWPQNSIDYVLKSQNLGLGGIDYVGYGWCAGFEAKKHLLPYFDRIVEEALSNPDGLQIFRERIAVEMERDEVKRQEFLTFVEENNLKSRVRFFDHHECHALSAFVCSPFEHALVLTCDGRGDFQSLTVSLFDNSGYEVLYRATSVDSLGFFYGRITELLGYKSNRHEGKITGLAAYGDPSKHLALMQQMISCKDGHIVARCGPLFRPFYSNFSDQLQDIIRGAKPEDIAAAAQFHLEEVIADIATHYLKKTDATRVCMAGGVFANVRVNQKILEIPGVRNVFVQPQMSDGGLATGAAVGVVYQLKKQKVTMPSMFLGPEFKEDEIRTVLSGHPDIAFERVEDPAPTILDALINNKVVGLFRGRMEFGPRALCHRSVLYHCRDRSVNDWLNKRMHRTEFMPFAPVTAVELAEKCYKGWNKTHIASYYMTITYDCTQEMKDNCPAAVHIDGTARPQVVSQDRDPFMHRLLLGWHEKTGGLSLINTSFNIHEEPIICTPEDAVQSLKTNVVDILSIGPFIVTAPEHLGDIT